ncbi:MAG TPA: protein kinase [Gemmataceae bacterium]|nr:protein kinase [Gemmataceae bacterium]
MISFTCSGCGQRLKVNEKLAGKKGKCPVCGSPVQVPLTSTPTPATVVSHPMTPGPIEMLDADLDTPPPSDADDGAPRPAVPRTDPAADINPELYDFLAPPQQPGELGRIGNYRCLKVLGCGGMGVVFEAEDTYLKRPVALKVMLPALAVSESSRQRFLREGQSAAAVIHDNVVTIYQVGEDRGVPFLAMQLLQGETLEDRLKRRKRLPPEQVLRIGREIAEGLEAAHQRGLIHRDIKPSNIWLEAPRDRVKLLDFGLARAAGGDSRLTRLGTVLGTPAYMSPEQANSKAMDARSDLFSLGCVLYRACTGVLPFDGDDTLAILTALALRTPPPVSRLNPDIPEALSDLIMKLLAKKPDDRPPSARAVAQALAAIESSRSGTRRPRAGGIVQEPLPARVPDALPADIPDALPADEAPARSVERTEKRDTPFEVVTDERPRFRSPSSCPLPPRGEKGRGRGASRARGQADQTWLWVAVAAGGIFLTALLLALLLLRGSKEGMLIVDVGESGADVYVDGELQAVTSSASDNAVRLQLPRGEYELKVIKDGYEPHIQQVAIASGSVEIVRVRLERKKDMTSRGTKPSPEPEREAPRELELPVPAGMAFSVLALNPKATRLVAAHNQTIVLWNLTTGKEMNRTRDEGPVSCLAFSPDGRTLATGSSAGKVTLRDAETLAPLQTSDLRETPRALAFSLDGTVLAAAVGDRVKLLDPVSAFERGTLTGHEGTVYSIAFTPDGRDIVTAALDRTVRHWNLNTHAQQAKSDGPSSLLGGPQLSPDGKLVIWRRSASSQSVWDVLAGQELVAFKGRVFFVPNTRLVLVGADDGSVALYDLTSRQRQAIAYPDKEGRPLITAAFNPDGKAYALSLPTALKVGATATLLTLQESPPPRSPGPPTGVTRTEVRRIPLPRGVTAAVFAPDGRQVVLGCSDATLWICDLDKGQAIAPLTGKERRTPGPLSDLCFLRRGPLLLAAGPDGIRLWDLALRREVPRFDADAAQPGMPPAVAAALAADGSRALTRTGRTLRLWDVETGKVVKSFESPNQTDFCLALSPDGKRALDGITLWDLTTFQVVRQLEGHTAQVSRVAFSPDGRFALTASALDGTLRLWEVETGVELQVMRGHTPSSIAFSPDGRFALSGGPDRTIRLWELASGRERHRFEGHTGDILCVAFSPDGQHILSGSDDQTARLWAIPPSARTAP